MLIVLGLLTVMMSADAMVQYNCFPTGDCSGPPIYAYGNCCGQLGGMSYVTGGLGPVRCHSCDDYY